MAKQVRVSIDTSVLTRIIGNLPAEQDKALRSAAAAIATEIQMSMKEGDYIAYPRGDGRVHYSSSPGSPPAPDIGTLRASIRHVKDADLDYRVTDGVEYGADLEYGKPYTAPRPFFTPVLKRWQRGAFRAMLEKLKV